MFCRSLIVLFLLAIVLFVPRFTDSDYTFGIFKFFLRKNKLCRGKNHTHKTHIQLLNFQSWYRNINQMRRSKTEWQLLMWKNTNSPYIKTEWQLLMWENTKSSYVSEKCIIIKGTDKSHVFSMRSHNRCHHKVKFTGYISYRYTLLQYYVQYNLQWWQLR
jgi:hypothetical protein